MWKVYIIECNSGAYYTGITTNLHKRIEKHNKGIGSKFVHSSGGVKELLWYTTYDNKSIASRVEHFIKKRSRIEKRKLANLDKYIVLDVLGGIKLEDI